MLRYYDKGELVWVAPGAVRYDAADTDFLLPWLPELHEGAWPAEPTGGYIDEGKRAGILSRAYYEAACQVAAELDRRLARTGLDRSIVEAYYHWDWPLDYPDEQKFIEIGTYYDLPAWEVRRRLRSAVSYIASGVCPRWLDCIDCVDYEKCRQKKYPPRKFTRQPIGISYRDWTRYKTREEGRKRKYTKKV